MTKNKAILFVEYDGSEKSLDELDLVLKAHPYVVAAYENLNAKDLERIEEVINNTNADK